MTMTYRSSLSFNTLHQFLAKLQALDLVNFSDLTVFQTFDTAVEDGTYYGITRGGRRPVLCPEHISKTTLARVMKFHGWIDLIQGECSEQES